MYLHINFFFLIKKIKSNSKQYPKLTGYKCVTLFFLCREICVKSKFKIDYGQDNSWIYGTSSCNKQVR